MAAIEQKEVQWHLAQMLGRMEWNGPQLRRAAGILLRMLDESDSQIVRVNALQALAELARNHPNLRAGVRPLIQECQRTGGPALRARARRLLRS